MGSHQYIGCPAAGQHQDDSFSLYRTSCSASSDSDILMVIAVSEQGTILVELFDKLKIAAVMLLRRCSRTY